MFSDEGFKKMQSWIISVCYPISRLDRLEKATEVVAHDSHKIKRYSNRILVDNLARFARSLRRVRVGGGGSLKKFPCIQDMFDVCSIFSNITSVASLDVSAAVRFFASV